MRWYGWAAALAIALAAGLVGWHWYRTAPLRQAESALAAEQWQEAQSLAEPWLRDTWVRRRAARIVALSLIGAGKPLEAEAYFPLAEPLSTADLLVRGKGLMDAGQWTQAAAIHHEILDREPGNSTALQRLCGVYVMLNRLEAARALAERLCHTPDRAAAGHVMLGVLLKRTDFFYAAAQQFQRALAIDPELADVPLSKGELLADLGECLLRSSRPGEAAGILEEAGRLARSADVHYSLALARYQLGESSAADRALEAARQLDPDHVGVLSLGARRALEQGDAGRAVAQLLRATELAPRDAQLQYSLAMAQRRAGNAAAADVALERAHELRQAEGSAGMTEAAVRR